MNNYQKAIENSNIVSKTDINGIITFVNDEFCKLFGFTKDELIGQNHNIVRHPDTPKENFQALWETILDKKVYKATVKNPSKDKKDIYLNTTIVPILDEKEENTGKAVRRDDRGASSPGLGAGGCPRLFESPGHPR